MTTFVLPGDPVHLPESSSVTLGPGIAAATSRASILAGPSNDSSTRYLSTKAGILGTGKGKEKSQQLWIEGSSKRYIAAQRELVLGTIIARHAEGYRVDIGSAQMAQLDALAFEGATKRSKPNLKVGTLVYARVSLANRDMEPELECVDPSTGKAEGFGELKGGLIVNVSLETARQLLNPKHPLLARLASYFPFETAIGMNGRIWFKAEDVSQTITLKRIVEKLDKGSDSLDEKGLDRMIKTMLA